MAGAYTVTISAVDAASGVLEGVNKRVEALNKRVTAAQAPFKRLAENFEKFSQVTGIDKIATGFSDVARAGTQTFQSLMRVIEPLAAITGAASLAGMYKLVSAWGDFSTVLGQQANRAGLSADSLYNLQNAAKLAGISAGDLTGGMTALSDNMRNAAFGAAPGFLATLQAIHLSYAELKTLTPEQQLLRIADALKAVSSPTDRALFTKELFGGESMIPFLRLEAAGIQELADKARTLTGGFSAAQVQAGNDFRQAQTGLALSVTGLGNAISNVLGPALTPVLLQITNAVVGMREWITANEAWLRGEISQKVGEFVGWLQGVNWTAIGTGVSNIATAALSVATAISGWSTTGKEVLAFFAVAFVTGMLGPLLTLTAAFLNLGLVIGAGLTGAFNLAGIAATAFSARSMALPIFRTMAIAAGLFDRLNNGIPVADLSPGVRAAMGIPPDDAAAAPGAPGGAAAAPTFYQRYIAPLFGGGGGGAGGGGGGGDPRASNDTRNPAAGLAVNQLDAARAAYNYWTGTAGYSPTGAAAMAAGMVRESGGNPAARNPSGTTHGGYQWDAARRARMLTDPRVGVNVSTETDMNRQHYAADQEGRLNLDAGAARARAGMINATDLPDAVHHQVHDFERSANQAADEGRQLGIAREILRRFGPGGIQASPGTTAAPASAPIAFNSSGDASQLPSASGAVGAPGATGRVEMNVRVLGAPAAITSQATGDVGVRVVTPGLLGDAAPSQGAGARGY